MNKVFKFRAGNDNDIQALTDNYIWFADIDSLNDPYEGYARFNSDDIENSLREKFLETVYAMDPQSSITPNEEVARNKVNWGCEFATRVDSKAIESIKLYYKEHRDDYKVLSVSLPKSSHDFPEPLDNLLIWSHYANGFKGFCLEFDLELLIHSLIEKNRVQISTSRVDYIADGKLPNVNLKTFMQASVSDDFGSSLEILTSFTKKEQSWNYENELRLMSELGGKHDYDFRCIKAIYIAEKMSAPKREELLSIIADKHSDIKVFEVRLHPEKYKLEFFEIDT